MFKLPKGTNGIQHLTVVPTPTHLSSLPSPFNTLRPRQSERHFADDIFMYIFLNENCCILIKFSLKYVRKGPIDNNPALVQIMAWRRSGDKPSSEPMMVSLPTHICVTRPQWVNKYKINHLVMIVLLSDICRQTIHGIDLIFSAGMVYGTPLDAHEFSISCHVDKISFKFSKHCTWRCSSHQFPKGYCHG